MENTEVAVTSPATSASSLIATVKSSVESSTPTSSKSKRTAKKCSVKPSRSTYASSLKSTAKKNSIASDTEDTFRYVLPQINLPPDIERLDDSKKVSYSYKKSVEENTKVSVTDIAPTASISKYTVANSCAQPTTKVYRYYLPPMTPQLEIKRPDGSQKVSYSCEKSVKENTRNSVPGIAYTSRNTMDNSSLESSSKDLSRYVFPQKNLQPEIKRVDDGQKTSFLFTIESVLEKNTKTSATSIIAPTTPTSSNVMDSSFLKSINKYLDRYVLPQITLQPENKRLDDSQKVSYSYKELVKENTKASVPSRASTSSNIIDNISLQSGSKDLAQYVLPQKNLQPEIKRVDDGQKTSFSFTIRSVLENTKTSEASIIAPTSSNVIDNGSLQSSNKDLTMRGTHHTTTQDILPKAFKPVILQNNSVKNPNPIGTGSLIENSEVACTSAGPVAISSKKTVGSSFYVVDGDGKLSLIVMDDSGEPTGRMKFRNGVPDEQLYPLNFTESHKPDMAAIRHCIETALYNSANAEDSYQNHIEDSRKVGLSIKELEKMCECKLSRGLDLSRNGNRKDIPPYDKLQEQLHASKEILHNLDKDILNLKDVFENINADRVPLKRTLSTMQNIRQLSFAESAEALNATRVMDLWLIRAQKLLQTSVDRIVVFYSIRDEVMRMLEQM